MLHHSLVSVSEGRSGHVIRFATVPKQRTDATVSSGTIETTGTHSSPEQTEQKQHGQSSFLTRVAILARSQHDESVVDLCPCGSANVLVQARGRPLLFLPPSCRSDALCSSLLQVAPRPFMRETQRLRFTSSVGHDLVGILDRPTESMKYLAVFSHCFTCTKDLKAAVRISRELVQLGIGVFRFDFTGLGESGGDFSNSTFAGNCADLAAAIHFLSAQGPAPQLLIGHSLGGATSLATAGDHDCIRAVCTLAAPSDTPHLAEKLHGMNAALRTEGEGEVTIGGTRFFIREPLLAGLRDFELEPRVRSLKKPVLLVHSKTDQTLELQHAFQLQDWLGSWASLQILQDADHLFTTHRDDPQFLARLIALWGERNGLGA